MTFLAELGFFIFMLVISSAAAIIVWFYYRMTVTSLPFNDILEAYKFYRFKQEAEKRGIDYEDMMTEFYARAGLSKGNDPRGKVQRIDDYIVGQMEELKKNRKKSGKRKA